MGFDTFSFDPRIGAGIKAAGYTTPTPIQERAIPLVPGAPLTRICLKACE